MVINRDNLVNGTKLYLNESVQSCTYLLLKSINTLPCLRRITQ